MKNRRYPMDSSEVLIPLNEMDAGSPFSKSFKSARVPYRRVTKCAIAALLCIMIYAFVSFLLHLSSINNAFPPFDPRPISDHQVLDDGSSVYRIAVITDLDKDSRTDDGKKWRSYFRRGRLTVSSDFTHVSVAWDEAKDDISLLSEVSSGGRAMELSDLVVFDRNLLTVDDRTGILYKIDDVSPRDSHSEVHVVPWVILGDGPGNVSKSFKGEWMTVKDAHLYVGGLGKEWTNPQGEYINDHPMWVKRIDPWGRVEHLQWTDTYKKVRRSMGIEYPGYMVHEAVQWSDVHKKWFFLPRRVSRETYDEDADEGRGSNVMVVADEYFRSPPEVTRIGTNDEPSTRGFAAFQFVPNTNDELIIALKSEEKDGHPVGSYVTVFHISGRILLHEQQLHGAYKFEGLAIV
ncbi:apy-1 [Pristionchus pacificus]|uniref:Apy-1 n=1 Tax=Pristionchus pacificus TaxID=54126 RepID=A0A2A6BG89_PRIPA|nr:apy-1 [Pristionchus pacificus]|eukprot:PDM64897.1 apy-1 [Pristionchus pacificus]